MEGRAGCYIRQKSGKCLWNQIKVLDEAITKKKTQYFEMQQKYIRLEQYLKDEVINIEVKLSFEYDDGFKQDQCFLVKPEYEVIEWKRCPYRKYDCQDLYDLKYRVLDYHTSKWTEQVRKYNDTLRLLNKLVFEHREDARKENRVYLYYTGEPFSLMMYATLKYTEEMEQKCIVVDVMYIQDTVPSILQEKVKCWFQRKEEACIGTGLWNHHWQQTYILKVAVSANLSLILVKLLLQGIQNWIIKWNTIHNKDDYSIAGNYMDIGNMGIWMKKKWIQELKPLGYREMGRVNRYGLFEETQILLHLEDTKKDIKRFK